MLFSSRVDHYNAKIYCFVHYLILTVYTVRFVAYIWVFRVRILTSCDTIGS